MRQSAPFISRRTDHHCRPSHLGRIEDLTEGKILQLSKDEMLDHMVEFLTAGIQAPNP